MKKREGERGGGGGGGGKKRERERERERGGGGGGGGEEVIWLYRTLTQCNLKPSIYSPKIKSVFSYVPVPAKSRQCSSPFC